MSQLKKVVDPFGEVNVFPQPDGSVRVVATILMEPHREGAQTGVALDGSASMCRDRRSPYGTGDGSHNSQADKGASRAGVSSTPTAPITFAASSRA